MKGNPKRKRSLQRLIISSKNRHRGAHTFIRTVTAAMGSSSLSPPSLYTQLHRRIRVLFSSRHLFPPTIITHRTSPLHLIHFFFFEISYEGEYRRWKPLIVFGCFCLAVWLMSVGRELFKWI